jgi:hypothetical protein
MAQLGRNRRRESAEVCLNWSAQRIVAGDGAPACEEVKAGDVNIFVFAVE